MKTLIALLLTGLFLFSLFVAPPTSGNQEPKVSLKNGDWIKYSYNITGPPVDALRNLTWYRMDIVDVDGDWLLVNKTALSVNGTLSSSLWQFNLAAGQVYGWVIIPADLSKGDTFFDAKQANITIAGEEQKTLLGKTRTVTNGSDERVYREWDKSTGVYVHAIEHTDNYTISLNAVETNLWQPDSEGQKPLALYGLAAVITLLLILLPILFIAIKRASNAMRVA
jgi:hypothetical protein